MTEPWTKRVSHLAYDAWWKRPDPLSSVPVDGDPAFWDALASGGYSLLVTARQQGRVAVLSAIGGRGIATLATVPGPMGAATRGAALAIGVQDGVRIYQALAGAEAHQAVYVPSTFHYTGKSSVHDVAWGTDDRLWFVNTRFSALCTVEQRVPFALRWRPDFVPLISDQDCCHLNGMALADGQPAYATALGIAGTPGGWRDTAPNGGVLLSIDHGVLAADLSLPHSPIVRDGHVYFLESGAGRFCRIARLHGRVERLCETAAIVRGLARGPDHWFLGTSRVRESSGAVAEALRDSVGGNAMARLIALDPTRFEEVGAAQLPFLDEIASVTVLPFAQARIAEASVADLAQFWLYAEADRDLPSQPGDF